MCRRLQREVLLTHCSLLRITLSDSEIQSSLDAFRGYAHCCWYYMFYTAAVITSDLLYIIYNNVVFLFPYQTSAHNDHYQIQQTYPVFKVQMKTSDLNFDIYMLKYLDFFYFQLLKHCIDF